MKKLLKSREFWGIFAISLVFVLVYSYLPLSQLMDKEIGLGEVSYRFNTPDEVTNHYFASQYAQEGEMQYFEPLNSIVGGVVFPRWAKPVGDMIVPGTFQGVILVYGVVGKVLGTGVIPFLTPIFAVLAAIFLYLITKMLWNRKVAFISFLLLLIFPGWWYYASRTMFHNILFISMLLAGMYFLLRLVRERKYWLAVLAGLFLGLSLITRTSELVWVFVIVAGLLLCNIRSIGIKKILIYSLIIIIMLVIVFVPVLVNNKELYGSYFSGGYSQVVADNLEDASSVKKISLAQAIILPFGFHPKVMFSHVIWKYFVKLFWPWFVWVFAGFLLFLKSKKSGSQKFYIVTMFVTSIWLIIYYGSWYFVDSVDGSLVSIGSSYIRYFLPIYVLTVPLIALPLVGFYNYIKQRGRLLTSVYVICFGLLFLVASFMDVYYRGPESLSHIKEHLMQYRVQARAVIEMTDENDVILTDISNDKVLFPERKHLIVPQGGVELERVKGLLFVEDVYFFYRSNETDVEFLNEKKFLPYGLELDEKRKVEGGGALYRVKLKERVVV